MARTARTLPSLQTWESSLTLKGTADTTSARRRKNPQRPQLWLTPRRKGTRGCSTHLLHPLRYTYPCTEAGMHGLQAPYQHGQEWHTCAPAAAEGARPPPYDYELQRKCKPSAPSSCITRLDQSSGWAQRPEFSRGHRRTLTAQEQRPLWHTRVAALRKVPAWFRSITKVESQSGLAWDRP